MAAPGKVVLGAAAGFVVAAALAAPGSRYFEGYFSKTYRDPVGIPTACWGETGPHVRYGMEFTFEQCVAMHDASLLVAWRGLACLAPVEVQPHEAAALLSWTHNVGVRAACTSTLARLLRAGAKATEWCPQMARWVYGTVLGVKVTLPGLVTRRAAEVSMCLTGRWGIKAIDGRLVAVASNVVPFIDRRRNPGHVGQTLVLRWAA